ncbi:hypothetical protein [Brevibacillus laterosporus]|uniref:hypothetical protein n=1 Tax=Brevibacillus laterosporus TaxID=1465 RepID=UPI0013C4EAE7
MSQHIPVVGETAITQDARQGHYLRLHTADLFIEMRAVKDAHSRHLARKRKEIGKSAAV